MNKRARYTLNTQEIREWLLWQLVCECAAAAARKMYEQIVQSAFVLFVETIIVRGWFIQANCSY